MRLLQVYTLLLLLLVAGAGANRKKPKNDRQGDEESSYASTYDRPWWPDLLTGSQYNGTIVSDIYSLLIEAKSDMFPNEKDFATSIDRWPHCAEGSRESFTTSFDGILFLGPESERDEDDKPQFVLVGWDKDTEPAASLGGSDMGPDTDG
ncbi:hypothetical protein BJX65DRAFT_307101 [Aspergillus insuetus]